MVTKKPKVVIIGAGIAGVTAANKLYTSGKEVFDVCVVEGGDRIGGRIKTSEFCGDRIEMGATWIHGIGGSPVYKIAQEIKSLESEECWECMDELLEPLTVAEGGYVLNPSLVDPISNLFKKLMDFSQGKDVHEDGFYSEVAKSCNLDENLNVGHFLKKDSQDGLCGELSKSCNLYENLNVGPFLKKDSQDGLCGELSKSCNLDENLNNGSFLKKDSQDGLYGELLKSCNLDENLNVGSFLKKDSQDCIEFAKSCNLENLSDGLFLKKDGQNGELAKSCNLENLGSFLKKDSQDCSELAKRCNLGKNGSFLKKDSQGGLCNEVAKSCNLEENLSVGSFLRKGLDAYWATMKGQEVHDFDNWSRKSLEEGIFAMLENIQRTYTSASDLHTLDFNAESEYRMFPGKEITIAKGYSTIVESLASVLPDGLIQLGRKLTKIEWQLENGSGDGGTNDKAVKLHFHDGSIMYADHVIVTVSLGVLKQAIRDDSGMFSPPLPSFKAQAISRLGFGVVNKLFLQLSPTNDENGFDGMKFPYLQMVFHQSDQKSRCPRIPLWMRRTSFLSPIYGKSNVLISWFVGEEALELESLGDEEIVDGFSSTISNFLTNPKRSKKSNPHDESCNGHAESTGKGQSGALSSHYTNPQESVIKFDKVLKSQWGNDPLFLGSYSYVAVGSSGDDLDSMAEPLPKRSNHNVDSKPLQILFAGEATHRTHYSTTHGAYFSGLREANRLLHHYNCIDI